MELKKKHIELVLVFGLFLATLYLWTMPFQNNPYPYGDVDSSVHFSLGDYITEEDKPFYHLPPYINFSQGKWRAGKVWYPPQYHMDISLAQLAGGERFLPVLLFFAITCSSLVLTSYLLIRKLFGFTAAFFSSFLLMFSLRDISFYLFGLWTQVTSFAIIPLVLYAHYKFVNSADKGQAKSIYLYLSAILLAIQFFIHPQGALCSGTIVLIFSIVYIIIRKKFPFPIKSIIIGLILLAVLITPFIHFSLSSESRFSQDMGGTVFPKKLTNLFSWYADKKVEGVPRDIMTFKGSHKGYWIIPFFLLGVLFLLGRRKNQDLLMLSGIIGFHYLVNFVEFRPYRLVEIEALFVYPIALIGICAIPPLIEKFIPRSKQIVKYGLLILIVCLAISSIGAAAYTQLRDAYKNPPMRISPVQVEVGDWLKENTAENSEIFYFGPYVYGKKKWIRTVAQRKIWFTVGEGVSQIDKVDLNKDYFIIDYSDLIALGSNQEIMIMQEFEKQFLANKNKIYDKNNIKVYKIG